MLRAKGGGGGWKKKFLVTKGTEVKCLKRMRYTTTWRSRQGVEKVGLDKQRLRRLLSKVAPGLSHPLQDPQSNENPVESAERGVKYRDIPLVSRSDAH